MSPIGFEIKESGHIEHPDHFPHLDFMGRKSKNPSNIKKTPATSWGRIDHDNKVVHVITQNGMKTPNLGRLRGKALVNDIFARIEFFFVVVPILPYDISSQINIHIGFSITIMELLA